MVEPFQFSCKNLSVTYETFDGPLPALTDVSFTLSRDLVFVCGPNGSGKTTLLKAIAGTVAYDGQFSFSNNGTTWENWKEHRNQQFIWIPQDVDDVLADSMSIRDLSTLCNFEEVKRLAKKENVTWLCDNDEKKIFKRLIKELSGGQKQVLVGLIALSELKPLLLLDEVFGPFDNKIRKSYFQMVRDYIAMSHGSALIVSHDLIFAKEHATRLLVLRDGKISFDGKASEIGLDDLMKYFT